MKKNLTLFAEEETRRASVSEAHAPLPERMRPKSWEDFRGLAVLDAELINFLRAGVGRPPSLVLWGPPGCGKTTLARLIGKTFPCRFVEHSAVLMGVQDIREVAKTAISISVPTILFVDEIHRLNKGQQDAFLPHVESGVFILIGATTENPSFFLNNALLSRCRVLVLGSLPEADLREIAEKGAKGLQLSFSPEALTLFVELSGGDARQLLNLLEAFSATRKSRSSETFSREEVQTYLKNAGKLFYDRSGEEHYNMVSAMIKSLRGSDPDAALYWGFRMVESGEDPRFVIRRLMIFASEDIGNADPRALTLAVSTAEAFDRLGLPEGRIPLAHCITYLATAPKSNRSYMAMHRAVDAIKKHPKIQVPLHLRNAPTKLMKDLGYSSGYQYPHDNPEGYVEGVHYLPDQLVGESFYEPSEHGAEKVIAERMRTRLKK